MVTFGSAAVYSVLKHAEVDEKTRGNSSWTTVCSNGKSTDAFATSLGLALVVLVALLFIAGDMKWDSGIIEPQIKLTQARGASLHRGVDPCEFMSVDKVLGDPRPAAAGELVLVTGGSGFIGSH